jgi:phage-related protein
MKKLKELKELIEKKDFYMARSHCRNLLYDNERLLISEIEEIEKLFYILDRGVQNIKINNASGIIEIKALALAWLKLFGGG